MLEAKAKTAEKNERSALDALAKGYRELAGDQKQEAEAEAKEWTERILFDVDAD